MPRIGGDLRSPFANLSASSSSPNASNSVYEMELDAHKASLKLQKLELMADQAEFKARQFEWEANKEKEILQTTISKLEKEKLELGSKLEKSIADKAALENKVSKVEWEKTKLQEENKILEEKLTKAKKGNPKVFFDLSLQRAPARRIVIELFADKKPYKAEIFRALCTGENGFSSSGKLLHFKGTTMNYLYYNRIMSGGNIAAGNADEAVSIYGSMDAAGENLLANNHIGPGDVTMFLERQSYPGHAFGITLMKEPSYYGREILIGKVVEGMDVLYAINNAYPGHANPLPEGDVVIANSGQL